MTRPLPSEVEHLLSRMTDTDKENLARRLVREGYASPESETLDRLKRLIDHGSRRCWWMFGDHHNAGEFVRLEVECGLDLGYWLKNLITDVAREKIPDWEMPECDWYDGTHTAKRFYLMYADTPRQWARLTEEDYIAQGVEFINGECAILWYPLANSEGTNLQVYSSINDLPKEWAVRRPVRVLYKDN